MVRFLFFEHVILEHTLKTRYKTWFKPDLTKSKHQKTTKNYPILNQKTWFLAIFAKPNCISFQIPSNDLKNDSKMMFKNDLSMNSPEKPWHQKSLTCPRNQGSPNRCSVLFGLLIWAIPDSADLPLEKFCSDQGSWDADRSLGWVNSRAGLNFRIKWCFIGQLGSVGNFLDGY